MAGKVESELWIGGTLPPPTCPGVVLINVLRALSRETVIVVLVADVEAVIGIVPVSGVMNWIVGEALAIEKSLLLLNEPEAEGVTVKGIKTWYPSSRSEFGNSIKVREMVSPGDKEHDHPSVSFPLQSALSCSPI